jgi:hypothetical protein
MMVMRAFCDIELCSLNEVKHTVSEMHIASINETTLNYIPEGSHLHARCHENLKSHEHDGNVLLINTAEFAVCCDQYILRNIVLMIIY